MRFIGYSPTHPPKKADCLPDQDNPEGPSFFYAPPVRVILPGYPYPYLCGQPELHEGHPACFLQRPEDYRRLGDKGKVIDRQGMGIPASALPEGLRTFSLNGWYLKRQDGIPVLTEKPNSPFPDNREICKKYLKKNLQYVSELLQELETGVPHIKST